VGISWVSGWVVGPTNEDRGPFPITTADDGNYSQEYNGAKALATPVDITRCYKKENTQTLRGVSFSIQWSGAGRIV
jgi:hypothetical protein